MRRQAKAWSAGSIEGNGNSRGLFRRAFATRGACGDSKGSGAPALGLLTTLALSVLALLLVVSPASADYEYSGTFSGQGSGNGQLSQFPGRAAVEQSTGDLFVADQGNNRIQVFKPNSSGAADYLTQFGGGELSAPWGIAIDENAGQTFVYVADAANNRIVKYASDEAPTPTFTVDGSFNLTAGKVGNFKAALAVDPTTHDLLVADKGNNLVERFGSNGSFISSFDGSAGAGSPGAFKGLLDIAANSTGDIYVIDQNGDIVSQSGTSQALRYSAAGSYKATLVPVGPSQRPATVAVDPSTDEAIVSGQQDAVYSFESPTVYRFDASNNPLPTPSVEAQFDAFSGLAAGGSRFYAVLQTGLLYGEPFGGSSQIQVFADLFKPIVSMDPVANASTTPTSAKFTGTVNPNGKTSSWHFEYSADGGGSWTSTTVENAGAGTSPVAVSVQVSGLQTEVGYQVRLVASNSDGSRTSSTESFTLSYVRQVNTGTATNLTTTAATLNGTINPGGIALTECKFEYGTTSAYGQSAPCAESPGSIGSGEALVPVHAAISALSAGEYHFRLVAATSAGATKGQDQTFVIMAAPTVLAESATAIAFTEADLRATINPNSAATTYRFEYGTTSAYGQVTPEATIPAGLNPVKVRAPIAKLAAGTTYHLRVIASNSLGSVSGDDATFTTRSEADSCPNAAIRARQGASFLLDCRAYEMVSPPDKAGSGVDLKRTVQNAPDGDSVAFSSAGAFPGAGTSFLGGYYISRRSATAWSTEQLDPPQSNYGQLMALPNLYNAKDLSSTVQYSRRALAPGAVEGNGNLYLRDNNTGNRTLLFSSPDGKRLTEALIPATEHPPFGATDDLSSFVFEYGGAPLTPDAVPGGNVYEITGGEMRVVNRLPNGAVSPGFFAEYPGQQHQRRAISADGKIIYFQTVNGGGSNAEQPLYARIDGQTTIPISVSQRSGAGPEPQPVLFAGASTNGKIVYFESYGYLTNDNSGGLYRFNLDTNQLDHVTPITDPSEFGLNYTGRISHISPDGSTIFFTSGNNLAPGATSYANNFYMWKNGETTLIGQTAGGGEENALSNNGRYLVFSDSAPLTGYDSANQEECGGNCREVFRYDDINKKLDCVSCESLGPSNSAFLTEEGTQLSTLGEYVPGYVQDDGTVTYMSRAKLASQDVNGRMDVYQWKDGINSLISTGRSAGDSYISDVTPDGKNVFFLTYERLVGSDADNALDLYDARTDGGLTSQNAQAGIAKCGGENCLGAIGGPGPAPNVGSASLQGSGNAKPGKAPKQRHACGKKSAKAKKRCHSRAKKHGKGNKAAKKTGGSK